jgi:hypothetical protein
MNPKVCQVLLSVGLLLLKNFCVAGWKYRIDEVVDTIPVHHVRLRVLALFI